MRTYKPGFCRQRREGVTFSEFDRAFEGFAPYQHLPLPKRARLYILSCKAAKAYEQRDAIAALPTMSARARKIEEIIKSLGRIAKLYEEAQKGKPDAKAAFDHIVRASNHPEFERVRFDREGYATDDYEISADRFFGAAAAIERIAKSAKKELQWRRNRKLQLRPKQQFFGELLPNAYERVFRRPCVQTISANESEAGEGITFVLIAAKALGLDGGKGRGLSLHTVRSHMAACRKEAKTARRPRD
jgi:hypothetical protein